MKVIHAGFCDKGLVRTVNQDAVIMRQGKDAGIYAVADGMGGHANGELASRAIVETLAKWCDGFSEQAYGGNFRNMLLSLQDKLQTCNNDVFRAYNRTEICGSTLVMLFWYKNQYSVIYAGDSRAYLWKEHKFSQITVDDVWENQPELSEAERRDKRHPDRGKLTNAFGIQETLRLKMVTDVLEPGMLFLLCSDGLYKMCSEKQIKNSMKKVWRKGLIQEELKNMLGLVYKEGAADNVSAVMVKCEQG